MKLINMFFIALTWFIIAGCKTNHNPVQPDNYIDPKIFGDWFRIEHVPVSGRPDYSVYGYQIAPEGFMSGLGVHVPTGTLAAFSNYRSPSQILSAANGELQIYEPKQGMELDRTYSQNYSLTDSSLTFYYDGGGSSIYKKSKIGENVTDPITSEFFTIVDSDTFINASIWNCPSAYFGYVDVDSLVHEIYAHANNYLAIRFHLYNYNGVGTYTLGVGNDGMAFFEEIGGCMIGVSFTEQPNSGYITINEYDLQNNICSGTFEFYVMDHRIEFTDGYFRIPVYH